MNRTLSKYLKIFTITLSNSLAYFMELLISGVFFVIIVYILSKLWISSYSSATGKIEGFTLTDIIWYIMFTEALVISRGRPEGKIDQDVKSGNIAYTLNKPYNYLAFQLFLWLGESIPQLILNLFIGSIVVYFMIGGIKIAVINLIPVAIIVMLSIFMEFFIRMIIGLSSFWMEDINMTSFIYYKIVFIFGGMLLPLDFFPPLFRTIANSLPFGYLVYYPARLFVHFDGEIFLQVIKGQIIWILVMWSLCYFIYTCGLRRLNINGG